MAKERIGISISKKLKNQVDKQAKAENRTPTSLVARIVKSFVLRKPKKDKKHDSK